MIETNKPDYQGKLAKHYQDIEVKWIPPKDEPLTFRARWLIVKEALWCMGFLLYLVVTFPIMGVRVLLHWRKMRVCFCGHLNKTHLNKTGICEHREWYKDRYMESCKCTGFQSKVSEEELASRMI